VVIDDFDIGRPSFGADETDRPLVIDADGKPAGEIAFQGFQPISRRHTQVRQLTGLIEKTQLSQGNGLNIRRQLAATETGPDFSVSRSAKPLIMAATITHGVMVATDRAARQVSSRQNQC
jgi:hypothetical protein